MKNKISSSIIAVIEESLERVKLIEENIRSSKENLYLAEHKLSKKLKLLEKMNIMCNKEKELYTKNDLKRISKNALLVKAEIDLIKKKKEKLNISISEDNERLNDIFNLLTEKGVAVKRNDLLKSLMNEKIRFYEYNYFNREEVLDKYNNIYIIDTNIFIDEPYILNYIRDSDLIIISKTVIDELDGTKLKKDIAYNVREAIRNIFNYTGDNIIFMQADKNILPDEYRITGDNLILSIAIKYKSYNPIIVTNDIVFSLKAKGENIRSITLKDIKEY